MGPARLVPAAGRAATLEEGPLLCALAPGSPSLTPGQGWWPPLGRGTSDHVTSQGPAPVCSCLASHLLGPLRGKLRLGLLADLTGGLRAPLPGVAHRRGPGDAAHSGGSCQWQAWSGCILLPPTLLTPSARPRNAPPLVTSLSCPSCLERKPSRVGPGARAEASGVGGLGLCWACLPRGRLTCRPRCHGLSAGRHWQCQASPCPSAGHGP